MSRMRPLQVALPVGLATLVIVLLAANLLAHPQTATSADPSVTPAVYLPYIAKPIPPDHIFYVAPDGDDSNPGTFELPWATPKKAGDTAKAGDTVYFMTGTYMMDDPNGLRPVNSGRSDAWIVFTAYPGEHPKLVNSGEDGVALRTLRAGRLSYDQMRSYIEISGLSIQGGRGKGIRIDQAHHLRIINNIIHDSGSAGISAPNGSDHILIEGNVIYGNANAIAPCASGISIWNSGCFWGVSSTCKVLDDGAPGYHAIIRGNLIYANRNDDANCGANGPSDGNGIIMDNNGELNPLTLIANNLIVRNGGRCVQVLNTSHVHVFNNTCYQNAMTPRLMKDGELQITELTLSGHDMDTTDVVFANNIVYGNGEAVLTRIWNDDMPQYVAEHNLLFNGPHGDFVDGPGTLLDSDPLFSGPPACIETYDCDWASMDLHLQVDSPAIDAGMNEPAVPDDYDGVARPQGNAYDMGAYEQ